MIFSKNKATKNLSGHAGFMKKILRCAQDDSVGGMTVMASDIKLTTDNFHMTTVNKTTKEDLSFILCFRLI